MVYDFGTFDLMCGPGGSSPSWGYNHIKWRHMQDFQNLAVLAGLNWSDLVHWSIYYNIHDPDRTVVSENTGCKERILTLHDKNGKQVMSKRFIMVYNATDGRIINAIPGSRC